MNTDFLKKEAVSLIELATGCVLYSLSVVWFIDPIHIIPGSVTGIGVVVKALTGFPIGRLNFIINVPLVIIGTIILGKRLLVYTGLTVLLTSVMMDAFSFMKPFTTDVLLASIFGGVIMGIGLGMILDSGGTTGGTTVMGRLVNKKKPDMPMGDILLIGDFIIITMGSLMLKDWDLMLYSIIDLYICVVFINMVMYGPKVKSLSVIYSEHTGDVVSELRNKIPGKIMSEDGEKVILISSKKSLGKIQNMVDKIDAGASCVAFYADHSFGEMYARTINPAHAAMPEQKSAQTD